jgi:hypothetical protein
MFSTTEDYEHVKSADVLNEEFVRKSWKIKDAGDILALVWFRPALAWKCTIKRCVLACIAR